jgi:hypothetical protein
MTEIQDRYVIVRMDPRQIRRMRDGENIRRQQIRQFKKKQIGDNLMELARG